MAAVLTGLLTSCTADKVESRGADEARLPILLAASPGGAVTRAGDNVQTSAFDAGEQINAYIWDSDNNMLAEPLVLTTSEAQNGANALSASEEIFYPVGNKTVSLYAVYPSTVLSTTTSFTVAADQNADEAYKASDLMHASAAGVSASPQAIPLTFSHKMSKLIVRVTGDGTIDNLNVTGITVKGFHRTVGFNPATGELGELGAAIEDIKMTNGGACLFPPQTKSAGEFIVVHTTVGNAMFAIDADRSFQSGSVYTVVLQIGAQNISQTVTITGWNDNTSTVNIQPLAGTNFVINPIAPVTYNGTAHEPAVSVTLDGNPVAAADYDTYYLNNINAGTASVVVAGKGDYKDYCAVRTFTINKAAGQVYFTTPSYNKQTGDANFTQLAHVDGDAVPVYSVLNANTNASVNATTGEVSVGTMSGTATIVATVADTQNYTYAEKTASYLVVVGDPAATAGASVDGWGNSADGDGNWNKNGW